MSLASNFSLDDEVDDENGNLRQDSGSQASDVQISADLQNLSECANQESVFSARGQSSTLSKGENENLNLNVSHYVSSIPSTSSKEEENIFLNIEIDECDVHSMDSSSLSPCSSIDAPQADSDASSSPNARLAVSQNNDDNQERGRSSLSVPSAVSSKSSVLDLCAHDSPTDVEQCGVFYLKVVYSKDKTGFEENKDFPIRCNDVIAGRYEARLDTLSCTYLYDISTIVSSR